MQVRTLIFLFSSFLSAVGDTVMVFAVPAGLGLETNDIRSAVLMWLIPAVAMFLSSFFHTTISRRRGTVRKDYALLLLILALVELIIAVLALIFKTPLQTVLLVSSFIFLYALMKEGIPRILYNVAVFRFFIDSHEYSKVVGINTGLNILAAFIGAFFASLLVSNGDWRLAIIFDALTFLVLGGSILFAGKNEDILVDASKESKATNEIFKEKSFKYIYVAVPIIYGVNALVWNHLPLISQTMSVTSASAVIVIISLLRLPGLFGSFAFSHIAKLISPQKIVAFLPASFILSSLVFAMYPSMVTLMSTIFLHGIFSGIYWASDFTLRNQLNHVDLIKFNTSVLRRLSSFQFVACCTAIIIFNPANLKITWIPFVILLIVLASILSIYNLKRLIPINLNSLVLASLGMLVIGCSDQKSLHYIYLPSISKNLDLRSDLTFAGMSILNETSAHYFVLDKDLTVQGQVVKSVKSSQDGRLYTFNLDDKYRSSRGDTIDTKDIEYSIKFYLTQKTDLASPFKNIAGSHKCSRYNCSISGLEILSPHSFSLLLTKPDFRFIEKLTSPWLLILKSNHEPIEKIGDCLVPYQTGRSHIFNCDLSGIHMKVIEDNVIVSDKVIGNPEISLVTNNPGNQTSPTLTVLSMFGIPSSRLSTKQRHDLMSIIRQSSEQISSAIKLRWAPMLTPRWLGIDIPKKTETPVTKLNCPKNPIRIVLDTSEPYLDRIQSILAKVIPCKTDFEITRADKFFDTIAAADIALAWFTPDYLDIYNTFTPFDCSNGSACYFNWGDQKLQKAIDILRSSSDVGAQDKAQALKIEEILENNAYVVPIAEMNWWIRDSNGSHKPIHGAGLFQVKVGDFL